LGGEPRGSVGAVVVVVLGIGRNDYDKKSSEYEHREAYCRRG
jgi:hypothetical protein